MRIAIIGFGRMGKLIAEIALEAGHEVPYKINSSNKSKINDITDADVAIEFTHPSEAVKNFEILASNKIPTVTGTTGWYTHFEKATDHFEKNNTPFFYASNFSVGVHLATAASNYLAKLIQNFPEYEPRIEEWHHTHKKDAPSGTAISIGEAILKNHRGYSDIDTENEHPEDGSIPIIAHREGEIPGTHRITYTSAIDSIHIEHRAFNRNGFATGALKAAEFLVEKNTGIYNMNDLIKLAQ
ncbi:MAG: 4-hydroxy-tetrahydrodipicolinate reductase [Flavobacteriales bacterium]|nr:4-hydroxy-tetrahydrodipicolinate reductase [Flavobacteriales bacterium]